MAYAQSSTSRNWRGYRYFEQLWSEIGNATAMKTTIQKMETPLIKKAVRMSGTWNGATVTLYGSNLANPDETVAGNWFILKDTAGNNIALTADGDVQCEEACRWIVPMHAGGGVTQDVDVLVTAWPS